MVEMAMAARFIAHEDTDGTWSIIDGYTGLTVTFAGRELVGIPVDLYKSGLFLLNEIDAIEARLTTIDAGPAAVTSSLLH
jgi:hypothetical protein